MVSILAKELGKDALWQDQQIKEFAKVAGQYIL
jgi:hypothetical protein